MLDTVEKFKYKADIFENDFKQYLNGREDSINLLNKYVVMCNIKFRRRNYLNKLCYYYFTQLIQKFCYSFIEAKH